jgi:hypothetical protein
MGFGLELGFNRLEEMTMISSDLAPFAFTVRARSARTVNVGFGGASRR